MEQSLNSKEREVCELDDVIALRTQHLELMEREKANIESQLSDAATALETLTSECRDLEGRKASLTSECRDLEGRKASLTSECRDLEGRKASLTSECRDLEGRKASLRHSVDQQQTENKEVAADIEQKRSILMKLQVELEQNKAELEDARAKTKSKLTNYKQRMQGIVIGIWHLVFAYINFVGTVTYIRLEPLVM